MRGTNTRLTITRSARDGSETTVAQGLRARWQPLTLALEVAEKSSVLRAVVTWSEPASIRLGDLVVHDGLLWRFGAPERVSGRGQYYRAQLSTDPTVQR